MLGINCQEIVSVFLYAPFLIEIPNQHRYTFTFQYLHNKILAIKSSQVILNKNLTFSILKERKWRPRQSGTQVICYSYSLINLISQLFPGFLCQGSFSTSWLPPESLYMHLMVHLICICKHTNIYRTYVTVHGIYMQIYSMHQKFILILVTIYLFISRY